jgi:hypothetical protein
MTQVDAEADGDALAGKTSHRLKPAARGGVESNTKGVGVALSTQYVVALQVAGLLLLIAMVGAIAFSTRSVSQVEPSAPQRPLGDAGRGVEPF